MDDPASSIFFLLQANENVSNVTFSEVMLELLVILLIVGLNAFFVASEFALVTVRRQRIQKIADETASGGAMAVLRLLDNPTRFISAVQLGVTLASLALGWVGEPVVAKWLMPLADSIVGTASGLYVAHIVATVIAFSTITFFHVVLGELVPKMFALERAEQYALFAARPLDMFARVFSPVLWAFNYVGRLAGKLLGLSSSLDHTSVYTEDEIRQLVSMSQESGQINIEERTLIDKVFEFSDTTVKEAMIPRTEIVAISESCTFDEVSAIFRESGYSRLPVYSGSLDEIVGIIHSKDLVGVSGRKKGFKTTDLIRKPNYVVDTARLEDVLRQMQKEKFHFGFVVDEHGGIEGIITIEDLLEEIVGDISDEHDVEVDEQIANQPDGSYLLDGGLAVRDLNRRLELNLPVSEGYTTIAGFLMAEAGEILAEGQTVAFNGHIFEVVKADKNRIKQVRMRQTDAAGE